MKFTILKNKIKIEKNISIFFLLILAITSIASMQIYNLNKKKINKNYSELINNIYFQKTFNHIFNNLESKYANIKHIVTIGETFDKILNSYQIPEKEITKLKKKLSENNNLNKLKPNQIIEFSFDRSKNNKIINFILPVSRTEKIYLSRNIKNDTYKKENLITNLNKKIIFKEGKITQS